MLFTMGGGIAEADMGEGVRQRGALERRRLSGDREGATGANASVVGERRRRDDDRGGRDEKRPRYD